MNAQTVLSLAVAAALALPAPAALAQYTPRPGGPGGSPAATTWRGDEAGASLGLAFVTQLDGEALLMGEDDREWVPLAPNLSLRPGDRIWVQDDSRLEVRFPLGATAWVSYRSELDLTRLEAGSRGDTIQVALVSGEASFDVPEPARPGSVFQVDLPDASIRAHRAARFRVNTLPDGTAQVGVVDGAVVLETPDGYADVHEGQLAELQPDRRVALDYLPADDAWDRWVQGRADGYRRAAASARYLPADLAPYAHELDRGGRWVPEPAYGHVWVPAVAAGWSPYSNGRWVWRGGDYVWLAFDPWYAPFHYGRWGWSVAIGWFWVAPRGRAWWSPGYVGWAIVGDDVCWVPLGPNEVYYGYGSYGPASVNVSVNVQYNVTNVYVNSRVRNGVVVVHRDDFLRGGIRRKSLAPSYNPFERRGPSVPGVIGRPPLKELRPIRETRQPGITVKRLTVPPARVERKSQVVRTRPAAPAKEGSVYRKGVPPPPLPNVRREKGLETPPPLQQGQLRKGEITRKTQLPAGRRTYKRVPEPDGGPGPGPVLSPVPAPGGGQSSGGVRRKGLDR